MRYWILDPKAHRSAEEAAAAAFEADLPEGMHYQFVSAGDLWVCDICNATIDSVTEDGFPVLVPAEGSYALCHSCMVREVGGRAVTSCAVWSDAGCGCDGCRDKLSVASLAAYGRHMASLFLGGEFDEVVVQQNAAMDGDTDTEGST